MKTVSAITKAWITKHSNLSPKDLFDGNGVSRLAFSDNDMTSGGWTFVGDAEITVTVLDEKTIVDNKVKALREEVKLVRAEATATVTRIEGQIQSLLAITCDAELVDEQP